MNILLFKCLSHHCIQRAGKWNLNLLGHTMSTKGINLKDYNLNCTNDYKIKKITEASIPQCVTKYYRRFIRDYEIISALENIRNRKEDCMGWRMLGKVSKIEDCIFHSPITRISWSIEPYDSWIDDGGCQKNNCVYNNIKLSWKMVLCAKEIICHCPRIRDVLQAWLKHVLTNIHYKNRPQSFYLYEKDQHQSIISDMVHQLYF